MSVAAARERRRGGGCEDSVQLGPGSDQTLCEEPQHSGRGLGAWQTAGRGQNPLECVAEVEMEGEKCCFHGADGTAVEGSDTHTAVFPFHSPASLSRFQSGVDRNSDGVASLV